MADPYLLLRHELVSDKPSLRQYLPLRKRLISTSRADSRSVSCCLTRPSPEPVKYAKGFAKVSPETVNNESDVYDHRGKKYKKVNHGGIDTFLVHRNLNPPTEYSTTVCPKKMDELGKRNELTLSARIVRANEALVERNAQGEASEARRDTLRNMTSYKAAVVDDLVKQNRAKTRLILDNAERAVIDQREEMREFYTHAGSTQVLAMRELQIADKEHLKDIGVENREIFFNDVNPDDGGAAEYEEMVRRKKSLVERNTKIVDVLKKQALEKEMLRDLEKEENIESAGKLDALEEAELTKRMKDHGEEELEKQRHFETFNAIVDYRDYLRRVRMSEEDVLVKRETDFLIEKAKFNEEVARKQNIIKEERLRLLSAVRGDLSSMFEKQEQEDMEYYYTLQRERDIQMADQEEQDRIDKKEAMAKLMSGWNKIREDNLLIKARELEMEQIEKAKMMKYLELENNSKKAEDRKRAVEKDINRMEIMYQINERDMKRQNDLVSNEREVKLLKAEAFVREGKIKERMLEKIDEFKRNGLPERFLSNIRKHYNL